MSYKIPFCCHFVQYRRQYKDFNILYKKHLKIKIKRVYKVTEYSSSVEELA